MSEQDVDELVNRLLEEKSLLRGKADKKLVYDLRTPGRVASFSKKLLFLWQLDMIQIKDFEKQ